MVSVPSPHECPLDQLFATVASSPRGLTQAGGPRASLPHVVAQVAVSWGPGARKPRDGKRSHAAVTPSGAFWVKISMTWSKRCVGLMRSLGSRRGDRPPATQRAMPVAKAAYARLVRSV